MWCSIGRAIAGNITKGPLYRILYGSSKMMNSPSRGRTGWQRWSGWKGIKSHWTAAILLPFLILLTYITKYYRKPKYRAGIFKLVVFIARQYVWISDSDIIPVECLCGLQIPLQSQLSSLRLTPSVADQVFWVNFCLPQVKNDVADVGQPDFLLEHCAVLVFCWYIKCDKYGLLGNDGYCLLLLGRQVETGLSWCVWQLDVT